MYKYNSKISFGGFNELSELSEDNNLVIINVSNREFDSSDYWVPLNDGIYDGGNTQQEFAEAVNIVRNNIENENPIFVHCALGQSRSVSVLATAIAADCYKSYDDVLDELMNIRGSFTKPSESLIKKGKKYVLHSQS